MPLAQPMWLWHSLEDYVVTPDKVEKCFEDINVLENVSPS